MLISKFNRLIHNKIVWTIFATIVIFAFIFGFGIDQLMRTQHDAQLAAGVLNGENISPQELNAVINFFSRHLEGQRVSDEEHAEIRRRSWEWIATVRKAEKLGFKISDEELFSQIAQLAVFKRFGLSDNTYANIVDAEFGMNPETFQMLMRQMILVEKIRAIVTAAAWAPELEIQEETASISDSFTVQIAEMQVPTNAVTITDEDVTAYYEANTNLFIEPRRVQVAYVRFAYSNYLAEAKVDEARVLEYYDSNLDYFVTTDTNGVEIVKDYTHVQDQITAELKQITAQELATAAADELLLLMLGGRGRTRLSFWQASEQIGLNITTTKTFAATSWLGELGVDDEFAAAAFELDYSDPASSFSDLIHGVEHVYLLAPVESLPAYVAPLDNVRFRAESLTREEKMRVELQSTADAVLAAVQDAVATGSGFTNAITAQSMNMVTSVTFQTMARGMILPTFDYSYSVAPAVSLCNPGDFADPLILDTKALIIQLVNRTPAEPWIRSTAESQVRDALTRNAGEMLFTEWRKRHLDSSDFVDNSARSSDYEYDEEDDEAKPESDTTS